MPQPQQKLRRSSKSLTRSTPRASCPKSPKISKKPLRPKNTKSSRLKPKSCSKKKQTKTKDQETRVNAAEAAYQKEYDKLAEQAKHETEEEAEDKARLEREEAQRQAELEKLNTPAPQPQPEPTPAPAPQAQSPVVPQERGSSVGDFIAGILAIVAGALTPMSIGTTANTFLKNNGLPHF